MSTSVPDFRVTHAKRRRADRENLPPKRLPNKAVRSRRTAHPVNGPQDRRPRAGREAKLPFPAHTHMLRHACGYKLANDGHDTRAIQQYLGHKNITHTVRYTELAADRFNDIWKY